MTRSVVFAFWVAACAAVTFPAATAASICLLTSADNAAINASFLSPAICASYSPAFILDLTVSDEIPRVEVTTASSDARFASFIAFAAPLKSVAALAIASA